MVWQVSRRRPRPSTKHGEQLTDSRHKRNEIDYAGETIVSIFADQEALRLRVEEDLARAKTIDARFVEDHSSRNNQSDLCPTDGQVLE
jgi:hypothetical protein